MEVLLGSRGVSMSEHESLLPSRYLHFDGMTWPNPSALGEAQWRIVHGTPTRADLLLASSVIGAYSQLVEDSQRRRNEKVAGIRAAMVAA